MTTPASPESSPEGAKPPFASLEAPNRHWAREFSFLMTHLQMRFRQVLISDLGVAPLCLPPLSASPAVKTKLPGFPAGSGWLARNMWGWGAKQTGDTSLEA